MLAKLLQQQWEKLESTRQISDDLQENQGEAGKASFQAKVAVAFLSWKWIFIANWPS